MNTETYNFPCYTFQEQPCDYSSRTECNPISSGWKSTVQNVVRTMSSLFSPVVAKSEILPGEVISDSLRGCVSFPHIDKLSATKKELVEYLFLPYNWDTFNGQPARPQAMIDVFEFLKHFPNALPTPKPMLSGSGIVGLYWDFGRHYASLEFEGDGTYTYLTDSPDGYDGAEGIAAVALPTKLRLYLSQLPVSG